MQNLNTYKGKDVLVTTLHTTIKVFALLCTYVNIRKKWLCIFEFSNLSDALYYSYSKEYDCFVVVFFNDVIPFIRVDWH